jgi:hypothetical protein
MRFGGREGQGVWSIGLMMNAEAQSQTIMYSKVMENDGVGRGAY